MKTLLMAAILWTIGVPCSFGAEPKAPKNESMAFMGPAINFSSGETGMDAATAFQSIIEQALKKEGPFLIRIDVPKEKLEGLKIPAGIHLKDAPCVLALSYLADSTRLFLSYRIEGGVWVIDRNRGPDDLRIESFERIDQETLKALGLKADSAGKITSLTGERWPEEEHCSAILKGDTLVVRATDEEIQDVRCLLKLWDRGYKIPAVYDRSGTGFKKQDPFDPLKNIPRR